MAIERRIALFHGRVQGVGFRATTGRIASGFAVSGTVRNLPDGSVEVIAEGEASELSRFLGAVLDEFRGHIRHHSSEVLAGGGPMPPGFSVAF